MITQQTLTHAINRITEARLKADKFNAIKQCHNNNKNPNKTLVVKKLG